MNIKNKVIKKIALIIIILSMLILNFSVIYADDIDEEKEIIENLVLDEVNEVFNTAEKEPIINSRRYIIYDRKSKRVLYGKNENIKCAMASTTKIMTAIVVLENADLSKIVTINTKTANTGGSKLGLKKDDKITIRDLLYGLMLRSGNDDSVS